MRERARDEMMERGRNGERREQASGGRNEGGWHGVGA